MSNRLRITNNKSKKYDNIEDINEILESQEEIKDFNERTEEKINLLTADHSLDVIPEEEIIDEPKEKIPIYDARKSSTRKKTMSVKISARGKRSVHIQELDPNLIPPTLESFMDPKHTGSKIAVIGKPGTGKSRIIKSILYEKSEIFPCAQVFSGTEDSNHAYAGFIPSTFVFNGFSQSVYVDFIKRQKLAKTYLDNPWAAEIWDDITEDERIFNLPVVKGTYKNGRHWKILHILSLQYALDVKPVIRTNIDGTFILRETIKRNRKVLFENYSSVFDDYGDFCDVLDAVTNDFTALYIHNRTQSNSFEDCVFWYKARDDIPDNFRLGAKEMWMFHQERYNPSYVDPIEV
jgi:hypothetical protein